MDAQKPLPPLRDVIDQYGLRTRKALGQHFLLDANLTDKIARLAGDLTGHTVVEIGPGPGGLTRSLLATNAKQVMVVEKDARCIPALHELAEYADGKLHIIEGDATTQAATSLGDTPRSIVANLPYNVGTDLLLGWLEDIYRDPTCYHALILMFQKEVVERITAMPGTKAYGRLSVLAQWLCDARPVLQVPAAAFTPPPKVESAVVQLVPRSAPLVAVDKDKLEKLVAIAFQQRRKMLRSALKPLGAKALEALEKAEIDPARRPDQLTVEEYARLAVAM